MMISLMIAAALAQAGEPQLFAETEGWSIARHGGGCMMTREFGGDGNTIVTFLIDPTDSDAPLTVMVGNSGWSLRDADDEGYRMEFSGNDAVWQDLAAHTFMTAAEANADPDGVISIGFAQDAITPMMADLASANGLHLLRQGVSVKRVAFTGTGDAVRSLGECVRTLP